MDWLDITYEKQRKLQERMLLLGGYDPADIQCPINMYRNATAAIVEICEMLQEDTRWKPFITGSTREPVYNQNKFIDEWCDSFIYLLNVAIYSGMTIEQIKSHMNVIIDKNIKRLVGTIDD